MARRTVLFIAFLLFFCALVPAQMPSSSVKEITAWPNGWVTINDGWRLHNGDDPAYALPGFDDSAWPTVSLPTHMEAPVGFFWYRLHLRLPAVRPSMALDLVLPENAYEVFVNGKPAGDARIHTWLTIHELATHLVPLPDGAGDMEIAVRAQLTPYGRNTNMNSDPFFGASIGPAAVEQVIARREHFSFQAAFLPTAAIDLAVVFGGLAVFALYLAQREVEYIWLSVYLVLIGFSDLFYTGMVLTLLPYSFNSLFGDPVIFIFLLIQIEFTFAFARRRLSNSWRAFQVLLVLLTVAGLFCNSLDLFPITYIAVQAVTQVFVSLVIPVLLLLWFRRGNREAGWLILPSFVNLPGAVLDCAWVANHLHLVEIPLLRLESLPIGPFRVMTSACMNFVYLLAIGIVLFFRHTRVTREQTRTAAELQAAREIQSRLVPMELPEIEGCNVRAVYVPAAEVGGDFFQVLQHEDGSALIAVGDVSGKGLRAAMTGSLAIGALRTLADEGMSPAKLLGALNRQLVQAGQGGFVTLLCARLGADGTLTMANAGHLFPYRNGTEIALETGMPLGISMQVDYPETALRLQPDDSITFLSDGVVEARRADGELFGFERTQAISGRSPQEIAEAAQAFGQEDDITVLKLTLAHAAIPA